MVLLVDKNTCEKCWKCSVESELNGLPEMAYEGICLSNWPEADADVLGMILEAKAHCPTGALMVITETKFNPLKGRNEAESKC